MDILTPRGQITVKQEERAAELLTLMYPQMKYIPTPKDQPAVIDGLILRHDRLFSVAETKCRNMTYEQFTEDFDSKWLVTFEKIVQARSYAMKSGVPLVGMLYLVPDDKLLVQRLFNADGTPTTSFTVEVSETQQTVNGGRIHRANAYIEVRNG